jgi:hypothetical protein
MAGYSPYTKFYSKNPVLQDMKVYRHQRQTMNNPKDNAHLLRAFLGAYNVNPWNASLADLEHAKLVLTRLASFNKNSG